MGVSRTSDHILIKTQIPNPSLQPPALSKVPNQDLNDMNVTCTFKIKTERQNLEYGCIKDKVITSKSISDSKPQTGTSSILQSPKGGLKGHVCSLHLQNQDREPKFGSWVYQRPVTISKSRSRCQTPDRNLQHPPKPKIRT